MTWGKRRKHVRLYVQDGPTIEGALAGRTRHEYIIWAPKVVTGTDPVELEVSGHAAIPRERVLWYQIVE